MDVATEVFAEDIEALLERLEGIASARVVATEAGEIDRIYVTASADRDERTLRQSVTSALMSHYSLAVGGWRIRVARLRPDAPTIARWSVQRVDEVRTSTSVHVAVELRADDEAEARAIGRARGLQDAANRRRTAVQATLNALKSVLDAEGWRAAVETVSTVAMAGGEAVVVAVSIATSSQANLYVGAAIVEGNDTEAVIAATLDAVSKRGVPPQTRGWVMKDRRDQLESMRTYYRQMREPQRQMPELAHEPGGEDDEPEDVVADLSQIRPERQGGAAVGNREAGRQEMDRIRTAPKSAMEDEFFRHLVTSGAPVHIRCRDGYEVLEAVVKEFGTYSLLVETDAGRELIFKHGIISVRPLQKVTAG